MSVVVTNPMTLDEFLDWEERQTERWEFDGFNPVAMTGGTARHSEIQVNLITALRTRLRDKPCRVYSRDLKVRTSSSIRYPDAFVVSNPFGGRATSVTDPVVVFEILSPSTANVDSIDKNAEYQDTPSIQRYVMLAQNHQRAVVFELIANDWVGHIISGDVTIAMPEIDVVLPLMELYDGVLSGETAATG